MQPYKNHLGFKIFMVNEPTRSTGLKPYTNINITICVRITETYRSKSTGVIAKQSCLVWWITFVSFLVLFRRPEKTISIVCRAKAILTLRINLVNKIGYDLIEDDTIKDFSSHMENRNENTGVGIIKCLPLFLDRCMIDVFLDRCMIDAYLDMCVKDAFLNKCVIHVSLDRYVINAFLEFTVTFS